MNALKLFNIKTWIILLVFLSVVSVWGVSMVMSIIEYSDLTAIICVVSYFCVWVGIFAIEMHTNRYKFKYLFLGKKFKTQVAKYEKLLNSLPKKERKNLVKQMKIEYRRSGEIFFATYSVMQTPQKIWHENNYAFSYGNATNKEKIEYLIYYLNFRCETGGGLYCFFDDILEEPFSYEEYVKLVKECELFSKDLKKLLLNKEFKLMFEIIKKDDRLPEEDAKVDEFAKNQSDLIFDYASEIYSIAEKIAVEEFLEISKKDGLPANTKKLFVSKDNRKRICVLFDEQSKAYKISRGKFEFYDLDIPEMSSGGSWLMIEDSSFFETIMLALNEIKNELKEYAEIKI